jgi:hypothetical protein
VTFIIVVCLLAAADLSSLKAIPDLEKRSEAALNNADDDIDAARKAYQGGDARKMQESLEDLRGSVTVALAALEEAPKQARKSKYYKRAELKTRALSRRLAALSDEVGVDDRKPVEEARQKVQEAHDHLLEDIMSNKK